MTTGYGVAILTASDSAAAGTREDESGATIRRNMEGAGYRVLAQAILPDNLNVLRTQLLAWCESGGVQLILTTGGTGFSPRDCMPEATLAIAERHVPGIAEAIRAHSLRITPRAMLGRGVSVIRGRTLVINLPGSPKAVRESLDCILPSLRHGLDILCGNTADCAGTET